MQHTTGTNPSEPSTNDVKSSSWKFIIRSASYPRIPEAFLPHCNTLTWLASPQGRTSSWLLRGYIRFNNRTNYYTLKHRYSRQAEWIPVPWNDMRPYNEFAVNPAPHNAVRYVLTNPSQIPLHKVGFNIEVPDLTEDYHAVLWQEEVTAAYDPELEARELARKKRKREDQEYWQKKIAEEKDTDYVIINPWTGEEVGGTYKGHYWTKTYNKRGKY